MNPFAFLRSFSEKWREHTAEAGAARLIHDTDFDEGIRELHKSLRTRLGHDESVLGVAKDDLSKAIWGLYSTFAGRRISEPFEHCDCCITVAEALHLATAPLKSLDADDLYTISVNVPHTAGKLEDIIYFTPRILEHAALESCYLDLSQVFNGFQTQPPSLSDDEHAALDRFFGLVWTALKNRNPYHPLGIHNVVLSTAVLTGNVGSYLDIWRGSPAVYRYIAGMNDDDTDRLNDAYWNAESPAYRSVIGWFKCNWEILQGEFESVSPALLDEGSNVNATVRERLAKLSWA
jgi:hypothetical protein